MVVGLLVHTFLHYDYLLRHLKQIQLRHQLQSLLRIFDCCTHAKISSENRNASYNHHLLDYGVWSFFRGTNACHSLLSSKTMRAIFVILFFLHLFSLDVFLMLAVPLRFNVLLCSCGNSSASSNLIHISASHF